MHRWAAPSSPRRSSARRVAGPSGGFPTSGTGTNSTRVVTSPPSSVPRPTSTRCATSSDWSGEQDVLQLGSGGDGDGTQLVLCHGRSGMGHDGEAVVRSAIERSHGAGGAHEGLCHHHTRDDPPTLQNDAVVHTARAARPSVTDG